MSEDEGPRFITGLPPGHVPMVLLTPEQYLRINSVNQPVSFTPYFATASIASTLGDIAKLGAQLFLLERMRTEWIPTAARLPMALSYDVRRLKGAELEKTVFDEVTKQADYLVSAWKTGIQTGLGGAFTASQEQWLNTGQLIYAYSTLQYQTSVIPRMRRYWMSQYTPQVPDSSMAYKLFLRKHIDESRFREYAGFDGWDKEGTNFLMELWKEVPNERTSFRMLMRGAIDYKEFKDHVRINNWAEGWDTKLYQIFEWLPNARQAFTLYRRGKIDVALEHALMKAQGFDGKWHDSLERLYERIPLPRDAFNMYMRGAITEAKFDEYIEANEWEEGSAERLWAIYQNLPSSREAFTLYKRGKIDATVLKALYQADGYMPTYQNIISGMFERIPHPRDAFNAFMRGVITRDQFDGWVEANEWQSGMSDFLYDVYTRIPSYREAFYMWAKGLITLAKRDQLYSANGFDKEYHQLLTDNNYYVPTVYDLTRIADFVEIDRIWAIKILKERGLRDNDITKIVAMLKIRPLRDEIRRQITLWVKRYRLGWATPTQLEATLQEYLEGGYIQETEKTLITEEAELNYEDELMEEKIDIYSWYFKTAVISEEELLEDFLDLGIREEKANLMVELLKAQGYYGYY